MKDRTYLSTLISSALVRGEQYREVANEADPANVVDELYEVQVLEAEQLADAIEFAVKAFGEDLPKGPAEYSRGSIRTLASCALILQRAVLTRGDPAEITILRDWLDTGIGTDAGYWDLAAAFGASLEYATRGFDFTFEDDEQRTKFALIWLRWLQKAVVGPMDVPGDTGLWQYAARIAVAHLIVQEDPGLHGGCDQ